MKKKSKTTEKEEKIAKKKQLEEKKRKVSKSISKSLREKKEDLLTLSEDDVECPKCHLDILRGFVVTVVIFGTTSLHYSTTR